MARNDCVFFVDQYRIGEAEDLDAFGYLADLMSRMGPRVTWEWNQLR
jgi:hypothetical protein